MTDGIYTQLEFQPNALYEQIIEDLQQRHYSVVPGFLSQGLTAELREELLAFYEQDRFKEAAIGNHLNEQVRSEIRGDYIFWLGSEPNRPGPRAFLDRIADLVAYLNRTCFLGIAGSEFHYALYPEGTCYKRHLDMFRNDDRRKLSVICYLNHPDWQEADGGELVLFLPREEGGEEQVVVRPWPGLMVLFESQYLEHEVRPARRPRLSLTGWMKTH